MKGRIDGTTRVEVSYTDGERAVLERHAEHRGISLREMSLQAFWESLGSANCWAEGDEIAVDLMLPGLPDAESVNLAPTPETLDIIPPHIIEEMERNGEYRNEVRAIVESHSHGFRNIESVWTSARVYHWIGDGVAGSQPVPWGALIAEGPGSYEGRALQERARLREPEAWGGQLPTRPVIEAVAQLLARKPDALEVSECECTKDGGALVEVVSGRNISITVMFGPDGAVIDTVHIQDSTGAFGHEFEIPGWLVG